MVVTMSWSCGHFIAAALGCMDQPGDQRAPRSHEPKTMQLNLLLPVDTPPADLPQERQHELSLALAKLLLSAAGVEEKMTNPKLTHERLGRRAIVYVRQSTPGQVLNNLESKRRQYSLAERARELGFPRRANDR